MKKELNYKFSWSVFAKSFWEKQPVVVKKIKTTNLKLALSEITEDQVFSMLVNYSDYCRKIKITQGFKFYVDGQRQHDEEIRQILPLKKDKSFLGYHQRMQKIFSDYCLVCDELLQVSEKNLTALKNFTDILFSHVGFPNRFVEMGLYLGNYRKTPFGVHVDGCGVFSFPVAGEKNFRIWTPDFVKKNPSLRRAQNYTKFKKNSKLLTASAGDMIYWPSSAWHIAESKGDFSATWSLGVWVDQPHEQIHENSLRPLWIAKLGAVGKATNSNDPLAHKDGQVVQLPENYRQSVEVFKNISENEIYDSFLKTWIQLKSKQGFKILPHRVVARQLTFKNRIKIMNNKNILWSKLKSEPTIIYAFQGTLVQITKSVNFLKLIKNLNDGQECLISDYLKGFTKNEDMRALQILSMAGAFL